MKKLAEKYNHNDYESKWRDFWETEELFHAVPDKSKEPYVILLPPPNVTSHLHMGHGLNATIQDILIRWKRMKGYNACWLPGTDHAGIATQMMVEKSLEKKGQNRKEMGREAFLKVCTDWKDKHGGIIIEQLKRMGASCDFKREAYTMDESLSHAVREIFVRLYNDGLIYRGERLVNWCPALKTAVSDDEVESKDVNGHLWYYKYPVKDSDEFVTIATTRPETMLGDTAVAINPEDERYTHLHGKTVIVPFVEREVPIVLDEYVKSEFGTGCVKITPAHDPNDFEIGKRHDLPFINVFNEDGSLNEVAPEPFRGKDRFEARKMIIRALKENELFEKEESNKHAVPFSERGKVPIEPMLSKQWYVKMKPLVTEAIKAAETGDLKFYPDAWKKTYFHWLENIQDWCISRQLWWGHRIPIWYCNDCEETSTGMEDPTQCSHCQSSNITQDEDVLDTWFSSWLWPISPFGWPEETEDLDYFYPSNVLVTAPEIIFLWVARMVMVGLYTKKEIPFKDVYFNSTICDKQGRKFSKTLGNGIDPLEVADKYGADAVRYTCVTLASLGGRVKMERDDFESGKKFVNKIWNAGRFLLSHLKEEDALKPLSECKLDLPSKWLIGEFNRAVTQIDRHLDRYQINEAVEAYFQITWRAFCDWGLESAKEALESGEESQRDATLSTLFYVFEGLMRLGSPIMPFVTEEIWDKLPMHPDWSREKSLCVSSFPKSDPEIYAGDLADWARVQELVSGVRSVRTQAGVPPKNRVNVTVKCDEGLVSLVQGASVWIKRLAGVGDLDVSGSATKPDKSLIAIGKGFEAYVPVGDYLDFDKERNRLETEIQRVTKIVTGLNKKMENKNFVDRAPAEIIEQTKAQLANMQGQLDGLHKNLGSL